MEPLKIRDFRELMRQLQRKLGWLAKSDAACCGITITQCHILLEVAKGGGLSLVDLAQNLGLDTSTISRTIDGMVKNGLVERKASSKDRRYLNITATAEGQSIFDGINFTFDQYYANIFAAIPAEKHEQIFESVSLLAEALAKADNNSCCREIKK